MNNTTDTFLERELQRLDLLLQREILRLRASYQLSLDEFRGLYVSDEQVDALLAQAGGSGPGIGELTEHAAALREANAAWLEQAPAWAYLFETFALSPFEQEVLLLALAPELDLKYETVYSYLNNDIARKFATVDLALRVCGEGDAYQREGRAALSPQGRLFSQGLLEPVSNPGTVWRSSLAMGFTVAPLLLNYLTGLPLLDPRLQGMVALRRPPADGYGNLPGDAELVERLQRLATLYQSTGEPKLLVFEGVWGAGRAQAAAIFCGLFGRELLEVDLRRLAGDTVELPAQLQRLLLQARLQNAGIYLRHADDVLGQEGTLRSALAAALVNLTEAGVPVLLSVAPDTPWREVLRGLRVGVVSFLEPEAAERSRLWDRQLQAAGLEVMPDVIPDLADRFLLNAGQIREAVADAALTRGLKPNGGEPLGAAALFKTARDQSVAAIGKLAQKVPLRGDWDDLVLPGATLARVRDVVAAIRQRRRVYGDWGLARRVNNPDGLMVLFTGPSGTGKTMTAGVMAREIGLDLYRIDLAAVVSKYIGETEKNLDRIFAAARRANAILFFDEADALFGKRSEIKDAHDRYANIEVAYLLQKMEDHQGTVILASNLSKNLDQAFSRRMLYVVEFPRPDVEQRERLWRGMFPPMTPLAEGVDFNFLARQFDLTGGEIRNVALDAAFLAADNGRIIGMEELIKAMARQLVKQGKVPVATDFKQYLALVE